ncbi:hypothetical protein Cni_G13057 [Canna indica]|uniref:Cytochrome P450 n=1 Tax=Canna indica TaxID=4628 RepID=A0AAQ3QCC1_9LILI|nr:hypothetical protein Cni_G13057 [Canna indica]
MELSMDSSFLWLLLSLLLSVIFLLSKSFTKAISSRDHQLPPGPKPRPIVGNLFELGDKPHRSLARLADVYGPIMTLRLGQVDTVVISSPDMAREVLQKHDAVFANRSIAEAIRVLSYTDASLIWLPPSHRWRNLRKICNTQLFTPQRLDAHQSPRREKVDELMQFISDSASKGLPVEIGRVAFTTSLNLLSRTIFSVDLADLYEESSQKFKHVVQGILEEAGKPNLSDYFPLLPWIDPQGIRRRSRGYFKQLHDVFDEQITRRIRSYNLDETKVVGNDFLDELLHYRVQEDGSKFDRHAMKSLFTDIFVAGSDTTSATVEWAMAELLRSPAAMAKVREEIVRVMGLGRDVNEDNIEALPYLQAVVKETLRLHPPAPLVPRRTTGATVELSGGYEIPNGTRVLINVWAIGRHEGAWKDAGIFSPERFLTTEVDYKGRDFELIPFGAGRRFCPGQPLAFRMVHLMLASLLQRFEWRLPEGMEAKDVDLEEKFGLTVVMASPLRAVAVPVSHDERVGATCII